MIRVRRALVLIGLLGASLLPALAGCSLPGDVASLVLPGRTLEVTPAAPVAVSSETMTEPPAELTIQPTTVPPTPTVTLLPRPTPTADITASALIARALLNHPQEYAFDTHSVVVSKGSDERVETQGRGFVKGDRYRIEVLRGDQVLTMIVDGQRRGIDVLMAVEDEKIAVRFSAETLISTLKAESRTPRQQIELLGLGARVVGTEIVAEHPTTVFETRAASGDDTARYWIWLDRGVLLKLERQQPNLTTTVEFTNYAFGPQKGDLFAVPADYRIEDGAAMLRAQATPTPAR